MTNTTTQTELNALNAICNGWTEARVGGLVCNPNAGGGIIDSNLVSKTWFVIFNDGRKVQEGYETREDAVEAFAASVLSR
jgi:hypothetical protein